MLDLQAAPRVTCPLALTIDGWIVKAAGHESSLM